MPEVYQSLPGYWVYYDTFWRCLRPWIGEQK